MKLYPRLPCFLILIAFLFSGSKSLAQTISVTGIISDNTSGEPLELANVLLKGISDTTIIRGTTTDRNGLFELSRIEPGQYQFRVSYVGYENYEDTMSVDAVGGNINKSVQLIAKDENLEAVDVVYKRRDENLEAGQQQIRVEDLSRVPTPAGGGDLSSYLQTLPGVVSTGDRGGQFFVRGGTPSENLSKIDGITIYRPFHIVGFFSVFPEEMVSDVNFYAGGFGPRYSGRTSSVLDVRLRNGDFYENRFSASVGPFLAEGFYEGPITEGYSSVMVLTRGSLIEQASKFYPDGEQPLRFNSQIAKISVRNDEGTVCSALTLRTFDRGKLDFEGGESYKWNNFLIGGRCALIPKNSNFSFFDVNVGYSYTDNLVGKVNDPERSSGISKFNIDLNYMRFFGDVEFEYGFFMDMRWVNFNISDLFQYIAPQEETFISTGGYGKLIFPIGYNLTIEPGVATSLYWSHFDPSYEPRLQISWLPRGNTNERINAAVGSYFQPVVGVIDLRDAGSAFTAWMPVPDSDKQMHATHALLGWRQPIGENVDFSIEGYHKWLKDVPISTWSVVAQFNTDLAYADGTVQGADVNLEFNSRIFHARMGYGFSVTEYESSQPVFETWFGKKTMTYNPAHDRRHQVNLQTGLDLGNFKVDIGWNYGSGLPFSKPIGFDSHLAYGPHLPDVTNDYGTPRILMNRPFNGRLPDYHSLNVSAEQTIHFERMIVKVNLGSINTYDQQNLFYYDVQTRREINQLPFYPYLSLKIETR